MLYRVSEWCDDMTDKRTIDKVRLLDTGKPDEMLARIEKLKRELPQVAEQMAMLAKIRRIAYEAHIAEGFTPEQALVLCCK